jgi:hypothetical protein
VGRAPQPAHNLSKNQVRGEAAIKPQARSQSLVPRSIHPGKDQRKRTRESLVTGVLAQEYTSPAGMYLCFQGSSDRILFEDYSGFTMVVSRSSIAKWLFP